MNKKSIVYGIIFFVMFPVCFQIAKLMMIPLNQLNEAAAGYGLFVVWAAAAGVLAGLFIMIMMTLHRKLDSFSCEGRWISLGAIILNIIIMFIDFTCDSSILFELFGYMFNRTYFMLMIMLLLFVITDICKNRKKA